TPLAGTVSSRNRETAVVPAGRRVLLCGRLNLALEDALMLRAQAVQLLGIEPHAERQPHLAQDGLDLVQRLLAEVLGLEQLGLGLLHEIGDRPDIGRLQAVGRPHRELQLVDVAEEVVVELGAGPRLGALGILLLRRGLGKSVSKLKWSCRMREASPTAACGA